jgi:phage baseplate assembly protein W
MGNGLAVKLPLFYDPVDGPYTLLKTMREVGAQNLKMLVLTNPGERIMNPDFGVGISRYIFDQEGNFSSGEINSRILSQVEKYLPYIKVTDIIIAPRTDLQNTYEVKIEYFIPSFTQNEVLNINLSPVDSVQGIL